MDRWPSTLPAASYAAWPCTRSPWSPGRGPLLHQGVGPLIALVVECGATSPMGLSRRRGCRCRPSGSGTVPTGLPAPATGSVRRTKPAPDVIVVGGRRATPPSVAVRRFPRANSNTAESVVRQVSPAGVVYAGYRVETPGPARRTSTSSCSPGITDRNRIAEQCRSHGDGRFRSSSAPRVGLDGDARRLGRGLAAQLVYVARTRCPGRGYGRGQAPVVVAVPGGQRRGPVRTETASIWPSAVYV